VRDILYQQGEHPGDVLLDARHQLPHRVEGCRSALARPSTPAVCDDAGPEVTQAGRDVLRLPVSW
jgi:hypothetical protein